MTVTYNLYDDLSTLHVQAKAIIDLIANAQDTADQTNDVAASLVIRYWNRLKAKPRHYMKPSRTVLKWYWCSKH